MLIAITGPDGSGKTTLAKQLADEIEGLTYIYFGSNPENRKYRFFEEFIKRSRSGKLRTSLKYLFIFLNDFYYLRKSKKQHLIADRSPIDKYVSTSILKQKYRHIYHRMALRILPRPDFIFILTGDYQTIFDRKKEVSPEVIQQMVRLNQEYAEKRKIPYMLVNTTENTLPESVNILKSKILSLL